MNTNWTELLKMNMPRLFNLVLLWVNTYIHIFFIHIILRLLLFVAVSAAVFYFVSYVAAIAASSFCLFLVLHGLEYAPAI